MRMGINEQNEESRILKFLYNNFIGRCFLRIFISRFSSNLVALYMNSKISSRMISSFINKNHINMLEYEQATYNSFNNFFTRKIKPEFRPIDKNPLSFISPCDSKLTVHKINENSEFKIKNSSYLISDLIQNKNLAQKYMNRLLSYF